jgi:flavodoxin
MTTVLVVYGSTHGHTARIAERIAERLRAAGVAPEGISAEGKRAREPSATTMLSVAIGTR